MIKFLISCGASVDAIDEDGEYAELVQTTIIADADLA